MRRISAVYVRCRMRYPDRLTVTSYAWNQVVKNTKRESNEIAALIRGCRTLHGRIKNSGIRSDGANPKNSSAHTSGEAKAALDPCGDLCSREFRADGTQSDSTSRASLVLLAALWMGIGARFARIDCISPSRKDLINVYVSH